MTVAAPPVGESSVVSMRRVVVLPAPLGPSRPTISPGATVMSRERTASTGPVLLMKVRASPDVLMTVIPLRKQSH